MKAIVSLFIAAVRTSFSPGLRVEADRAFYPSARSASLFQIVGVHLAGEKAGHC